MNAQLEKTAGTSFSRGLSLAASHIIDPEEVQVANNFVFSDGSATVRQGTALNASLPAPVVRLEKFYNSYGSSYWLAVAGGQLWVSTVSGVFTSLSCLPMSGTISITPYNNYVYFASYSGVVQFFNGSSMDIAGVSSPQMQMLVGDFTNTSQWSTSGQGGILVDTNFTHVGYGFTALEAQTSNLLYVNNSTFYNLASFGNVSSDVNDLIIITTTHRKKSSISAINFGFIDASGYPAACYISNLSSYIGCSSDNWTITHTMPKVMNSTCIMWSGNITSGGNYAGSGVSSGVYTSSFITQGFKYTSSFNWASCTPFIAVQAAPNALADITFTDCYMTKTPPIPTAVPEVLTPTLYYASAAAIVGSTPNTNSFFGTELYAEVTYQPPILDGTVFYQTTFIKEGPNGVQIESCPSAQSSGCILSTNISSNIVSGSGTLLSSEYLVGIYQADIGVPGWNVQQELGWSVGYTSINAQVAWGSGIQPTYCVTLSGTQTATPASGSFIAVGFSGNAVALQQGVSGGGVSTILITHYVNLTDIPLAPQSYNCQARNIYRRMATDPAFTFVEQITDNVTTTFNDNVPYQVLGQTVPTANYPPPIAKYIYAAGNQQTYYMNIQEGGVAYPGRVRYSLPYTPYYVPLNNVFDISPGDGTQITGMFEYLGLQFFLKERSTWVLNSDGSISPMHRVYGCVAPNSIAVGPQVVFWLDAEGIIEFNLSFNNVTQGKQKINTFIKALPKGSISYAQGCYFQGLYLLALDTNGDGWNDTVLCYDTTVGGVWSIFPNINVNCWSVWGGSIDGDRLFYGNSSGLVCEFLTGNTDLGQPIPWQIQCKDYGVPQPTEGFREAFLFVRDLDGNSRQIQCLPFFDMYNTSSLNDIIDTSSNIATSGIGLGKVTVPAKDGASYFSYQFSSSGRCQLVGLDIFSKRESTR